MIWRSSKLGNKDWLYQKYLVEKLSTPSIGKIIGCHASIVTYWINAHGIKHRTLSEGALRGEKHQFFGKTVGTPGAFKGRKHSEKSKRVMSELAKGRIRSLASRLKQSVTMSGENHIYFGKKRSPETVTKMSSSLKIAMNKPQLRERLSLKKRGSKAPNWKGGITVVNKAIRNSFEYTSWRRSVFQRDNFICTACGDRGGKGHSVKLNADHIKPFSLYPELRFELSNGRTLCVECHKKTDTYGRKAIIMTRESVLS